ncbi:MAG TPA: aspartate aminotransferase family protein [Actinomycetota bacterium]|nr:aspartate aminotransferase family protein [Actinomycetota bacterium]
MTAPTREEIDQVLDLISREARTYLDSVDGRPLRDQKADDFADGFMEPLPERGAGALETLRELLDRGLPASVASTGPRFFHFVIGGVTPAAAAADWLTTAIDQNPGLWTASPLGSALGDLSVSWLRDLFGLPPSWGGTLVTGGTMANYAGLACGRRWCGLQQGVDVEEEGLSGLPPIPVFSSGYIHASARKAVAMLGIGRKQIRTFERDAVGRVDLDALASALRELNGGPAIVIANAGEVNAGDFDPISSMADVAEEHGAWLHVDGAFGLFAALSPRTAHLVEGVDRAHSVSADGHKWLNVPQDCGFTFVRDRELLSRPFSVSAAYLATESERPNLAYLAPESSQRARGIAVWATLRAYGREGYREIVERHLDLAQRIASRVDEAPDLERLADVPLNIVCFRYHPHGVDDEATLDEVNRRIGTEILDDGRVYVGTTLYEGKVTFRPAIVNWRSRQEDVDLLVDVVRELGSRTIAR